MGYEPILIPVVVRGPSENGDEEAPSPDSIVPDPEAVNQLGGNAFVFRRC